MGTRCDPRRSSLPCSVWDHLAPVPRLPYRYALLVVIGLIATLFVASTFEIFGHLERVSDVGFVFVKTQRERVSTAADFCLE